MQDKSCRFRGLRPRQNASAAADSVSPVLRAPLLRYTSRDGCDSIWDLAWRASVGRSPRTLAHLAVFGV